MVYIRSFFANNNVENYSPRWLWNQSAYKLIKREFNCFPNKNIEINFVSNHHQPTTEQWTISASFLFYPSVHSGETVCCRLKIQTSGHWCTPYILRDRSFCHKLGTNEKKKPFEPAARPLITIPVSVCRMIAFSVSGASAFTWPPLSFIHQLMPIKMQHRMPLYSRMSTILHVWKFVASNWKLCKSQFGWRWENHPSIVVGWLAGWISSYCRTGNARKAHMLRSSHRYFLSFTTTVARLFEGDISRSLTHNSLQFILNLWQSSSRIIWSTTMWCCWYTQHTNTILWSRTKINYTKWMSCLIVIEHNVTHQTGSHCLYMMSIFFLYSPNDWCACTLRLCHIVASLPNFQSSPDVDISFSQFISSPWYKAPVDHRAMYRPHTIKWQFIKINTQIECSGCDSRMLIHPFWCALMKIHVTQHTSRTPQHTHTHTTHRRIPVVKDEKLLSHSPSISPAGFCGTPKPTIKKMSRRNMSELFIEAKEKKHTDNKYEYTRRSVEKKANKSRLTTFIRWKSKPNCRIWNWLIRWPLCQKQNECRQPGKEKTPHMENLK